MRNKKVIKFSYNFDIAFSFPFRYRNALYMEQSVESLSKQDNLNTYCASPKLDYCSQYELKMEGSGEDTDPDIIPCHYGMRYNYFFNNCSN